MQPDIAIDAMDNRVAINLVFENSMMLISGEVISRLAACCTTGCQPVASGQDSTVS
jgi:hypothetical protein